MRYHYEKPTIYLSMYGEGKIDFQPKFKEYFENRAGDCVDELYPTVTVRQIMWALKMKPIPRERWETVFDRRDI